MLSVRNFDELHDFNMTISMKCIKNKLIEFIL